MDSIGMTDSDEAADLVQNYPNKERKESTSHVFNKDEYRGILSEYNNEENLINNMLDHDSLTKVFSHLPVPQILEMKKVCRKWRDTVPLTWYTVKKIDFESLMIHLGEKEKILKQILMSCGQYLTHLKMNECHGYSSSIISVVEGKCENVTHFEIHMDGYRHSSAFRNVDLCEIIKSMAKLKNLKIKSGNQYTVNLYIEILENLPEKMEEIHLPTFKGHTLSKRFALAFDKFKVLRGLTLEGCKVTDVALNSILEKKNTLVHLDLSYCRFLSESGPSILSNLEYLRLKNNTMLDAGLEIIAICQNCPKLKYFEFVGSEFISNRFLHYFKYLKNLECLKISRELISITDSRFLPDMFNNCQKLKHFELIFYFFNLSAFDFKDVVQLKHLEYFIVPHLKIDSNLLSDIADNCLELKELRNNQPWINISEDALKKFVSLKKLECFSIKGCDNFNDTILTSLVDNCKNLVDLNIENCNNITEASLIRIGKFPNLQILSLQNMVNIPHALFKNLHTLKEFSCCNFPKVTDRDIFYVINNCPELRFLDVVGTAITIKTLIRASKRKYKFKHLRIIVSGSAYKVPDETDENPFKSDHLTVSNPYDPILYPW